jgi:hypothetical protein
LEYRYSPSLFLASTLDGVGGQRHAPADLPPRKTRYILYRRLGGPRAGLDGYEFVSSLGKVKGKGKAIPLQAWTGPEGSRRLRFPDFKTIDT